MIKVFCDRCGIEKTDKVKVSSYEILKAKNTYLNDDKHDFCDACFEKIRSALNTKDEVKQ